MNDAPQDDLTMAGHAKMLARSALRQIIAGQPC